MTQHSVSFPLSPVDHLAELPVVELVVPAGVKLFKSCLDLFIRQIFANGHKFLAVKYLQCDLFRNKEKKRKKIKIYKGVSLPA